MPLTETDTNFVKVAAKSLHLVMVAMGEADPYSTQAIFEILQKGFCKQCGRYTEGQKCFCASCYDE